MSLDGRVAIVAGASRGIGADVARYLAAAGAKVAVAARTEQVQDPRLPGTIHSVAASITEAGGAAVPVVLNLPRPGEHRERDPARRRDVGAHRHPGQQRGHLRAGRPGDGAAAPHQPQH